MGGIALTTILQDAVLSTRFPSERPSRPATARMRKTCGQLRVGGDEKTYIHKNVLTS
jgi:hypothetical protein